MYNRYIPSANGTYRRQTVAQEQAGPAGAAAGSAVCPPDPPAEKQSSVPDPGDLLVLLILLLVLSESDGSDAMGVLIAIAAFLLLP